MICHGNSGHFLARNLGHQVSYTRSTVEHRVLGVDVQMHK
jgi:hypothetical protein